MINFYKKIGKATAIIASLLAVTTAQAQNSLWAWGDGDYGKLGTGTTTQQNSPVQIGTATNWSQVSTGYSHTIAIKSDGTLWAWGSAKDGQLGTGNTTTNHLSPVQIGTATNWSQVSVGGDISSQSLAIKSDGTLWAWGGGANGKLGTGNTANQLFPVQIGTDTNWSQVSAGYFHSLAVKSDGTLWAWGSAKDGQLGTGNTTQQNSPVQIGIATNWSQVSAGLFHSLALKSNGTLWAWGWNTLGALGTGTTTDQLSPVQIGKATNWAKISAEYHSLALVAASAGIDKNEIKNFAVYPNPANSILNIDSNIQENIKITIVDITGKSLTEQTLKTGNNTINISSFANGVYFIKTEKGGSVKFIKN